MCRTTATNSAKDICGVILRRKATVSTKKPITSSKAGLGRARYRGTDHHVVLTRESSQRGPDGPEHDREDGGILVASQSANPGRLRFAERKSNATAPVRPASGDDPVGGQLQVKSRRQAFRPVGQEALDPAVIGQGSLLESGEVRVASRRWRADQLAGHRRHVEMAEIFEQHLPRPGIADDVMVDEDQYRVRVGEPHERGS